MGTANSKPKQTNSTDVYRWEGKRDTQLRGGVLFDFWSRKEQFVTAGQIDSHSSPERSLLAKQTTGSRQGCKNNARNKPLGLECERMKAKGQMDKIASSDTSAYLQNYSPSSFYRKDEASSLQLFLFRWMGRTSLSLCLPWRPSSEEDHDGNQTFNTWCKKKAHADHWLSSLDYTEGIRKEDRSWIIFVYCTLFVEFQVSFFQRLPREEQIFLEERCFYSPQGLTQMRQRQEIKMGCYEVFTSSS